VAAPDLDEYWDELFGSRGPLSARLLARTRRMSFPFADANSLPQANNANWAECMVEPCRKGG
jgi:hypothetical protein